MHVDVMNSSNLVSGEDDIFRTSLIIIENKSYDWIFNNNLSYPPHHHLPRHSCPVNKVHNCFPFMNTLQIHNVNYTSEAQRTRVLFLYDN